MKNIILLITALLSIWIVSCNNQNKSKTENVVSDSTIKQAPNEIKSYISLFEIPATEISRAINFYQSILDINIEKIEIPEMEMGIFPYEGQVLSGVIIKAEGYNPSPDGVTIYLNAGDNLQHILDKVEKNGGKIIIPKTAHADENGYFGVFLDSEGNKIGLHSTN